MELAIIEPRDNLTLGDFKTLFQAKERVKNQKKRLVYVIKLNKLKVKPSSFKFTISKERPSWYTKNMVVEYPYNVNVRVPSNKYRWIFEA